MVHWRIWDLIVGLRSLILIFWLKNVWRISKLMMVLFVMEEMTLIWGELLSLMLNQPHLECRKSRSLNGLMSLKQLSNPTKLTSGTMVKMSTTPISQLLSKDQRKIPQIHGPSSSPPAKDTECIGEKVSISRRWNSNSPKYGEPTNHPSTSWVTSLTFEWE